MRNQEEQITVSSDHLALRIIGFALALLVAVSSISYGVTRIGHKEPGYQTIETTAVVTQSEKERDITSDISFQYYCEGSSNEIKQSVNELRAFYSPTVLRVCQLLDTENEYEGMNNLATLNAQLGQDVALSEELFRVLMDAQARSGEESGYNLFAAALAREWLNIRYLSEPEEFDPLRSETERERMERLGEACRDPESIRLTVVDAERYTVRLEVSDSFRALLGELEVEGPILDLGMLHDAYVLQLLSESLEKAGYRRGFLSTKSGMTVLLSDNPAGELLLVGRTEEGVTEAAMIPAEAGRAACMMRAFAKAEEEPGYYELDGQLRHPWLPASGAYHSQLLSALAVADDPVTACCRLLRLQEYPTREALLAAAAESEEELALTLNDGTQTVYANSGSFSASEEFGWRIEPLS